MREKVVLAYSGGLDTSIIIPWLKENYDCDVIAFVADVGQGDDIDAVVEKAYKTGASKVIVEDLRQEFLTDYVFPAIQAGAVYEHKYLLGTSLARPIIAKYQVECALKEGATAVAHGCTGKGNDQVRFEHAYQALAPELKVIAPWREWTLKSREDCLDYAEAHGIPVTQSREKIHSRDRNLLHVSHEGGELEDPNNAPLPTTWTWTKSPQEAPDKVEKVSIEFKHGLPVAVNGVVLDPVAIVEVLNEIGARNAIGRIDLVENRFVGIKSRGCYETPGGTLLLTAHRELEALCLDRELAHFKQHIGLKYAEIVYFGLWFTPLRESLQAFVKSSQNDINGTVTLALYKGNIDIAGRKSETSMYRPDVASFTMGDELRPEGRGRIHPHSGAAGALACADSAEDRGREVKMWSGRFSQELNAGLRTMAALVSVRSHPAAVRSGGEQGACCCARQGGSAGQRGTRADAQGAGSDRGEGIPSADDPAIEDVHHYVEKRLVELAGEVGYKLHTGRSRNEQIATDLRLYVRAQIDAISELLVELAGEFVNQAETRWRRCDAVVHASAAGGTGAGGALAAGVCRDVCCATWAGWRIAASG